jgi:lysophospholipase L1-like esterase
MANLPVVLCYGDSNTYGADPAGGDRLPYDVRWPGVLAGLLEGEARVIEEGLNGRTTVRDDPYSPGRNGLAYLVPCLDSHAPIDVVVIMLGTNDLKATFGLVASDIAAGAATLVDTVLLAQCGPGTGAPQVLLVAPPALGAPSDVMELWGFAGANERNAALPRLYRAAALRAGVGFLDASAIVIADPADGIHLSAESHRTLAHAVAGAVRPLLAGG